jgi:hypothetical protein
VASVFKVVSAIVGVSLAAAALWLTSEVADLGVSSVRPPEATAPAATPSGVDPAGANEALQREAALGALLRLRGILMVKGAGIEPRASVSLGPEVGPSEFKQGDVLLGHWQLQAIADDSVTIRNSLSLQRRILSLEPELATANPTTGAAATPDRQALFSDPRLKFAAQPRPNLNKPDIVDSATWADMKSKYGL